MSQNTILAVGAHIGDAQLTCGMLLAKHALAGDRVVIVDLTAGERGAPAGETQEAFRARNVASADAFAKVLGGESVVFDIPDGELYASKELELRLAAVMRRYQPNTLLCHWQKSMHKDHVAASAIATNAGFYASLASFPMEEPPAPIRRTLFAENWEDAEDFVPYCYFDVTEAFPLWKDAIRKLWLAEHSRDFRYLRYYEALAITRGALIRTDYATAFAVEAHCRRVKLEL